MSKQLVLISHGRFCEELKHSTEMIMGPQESIHSVALLPEEGPDDFLAKFLDTIRDLMTIWYLQIFWEAHHVMLLVA